MKKITVLTNIRWAPEYNHYLDVLSYGTKEIYVNKNNIETAEEKCYRVAIDEQGFRKKDTEFYEFTMSSGTKYITEDMWVIE